MALENLHLMFLYVAFCITRVVDTKFRCNLFLGIKCFLWIFKVSPRVIVQVRIYLWQLSIYVASDLEMLFPCLTFVEWETNREKKLRVKEGGAPELTHRLRNRHGPMVAQRCLGAKTNSPRKFALVSCIELPKRTQIERCFGLIFVRNDFISVRSSISFCIYWGLYSPSCRSKPVRPLLILEHKLRYFWWNPRAFWPCIDSNATEML